MTAYLFSHFIGEEKDGDYYLLFGNGEAAIAKLAEDMVHIEEDTLHNIKGLKDSREAVTVLKRDNLLILHGPVMIREARTTTSITEYQNHWMNR